MTKTPDDYLPGLLVWDEETFDQHWEQVQALLDELDEAAVLASAVVWCRKEDPATQAVGLDVLGVLAEDQPDVVGTLLGEAARLVSSPDEDVRWSGAVALGRQDDQRVEPLLLRYLADSDPDVRWQAVSALPVPTGDDLPPDHPVVRALLNALEDSDADVCDWAAFGLGVQLDVDTPEIRDALARHLFDTEADTAGEVAVALAKRKDSRVLDVLIERLANPEVGNLYVEAAAELGDPQLLPLLVRLKEAGWQEDDEPRPGVLDEAITRCSPGSSTPQG